MFVARELFVFVNWEKASEFAQYAGHPIADNVKVQAAKVLILKTGNFPVDYKDWRSNPPADRTWEFFQEFWSTQFDLKQETEQTAGSIGFGNAAEAQDDESIATYNETVANFGTAFAANSNAFSQLTDTNNSLVTNMNNFQNQLNAITTQLQHMATNNTPAPALVDISQAYQHIPMHQNQQQKFTTNLANHHQQMFKQQQNKF